MSSKRSANSQPEVLSWQRRAGWLVAGAAIVIGALAFQTQAQQPAAPAEAPAAPAEAPAVPAAPAEAPAATPVEAEPDPASVDIGRRAYLRANCVYCHGWNGKGALVEGEPPAPGFVETQLDRAAIIETVSCGRIATTMRRHLREAWSAEHPCYGLTEADLTEAEMPLQPYAWLNQEQIEGVADYILAVFKGKEMTKANCEAWFRPGAPQCAQYE